MATEKNNSMVQQTITFWNEQVPWWVKLLVFGLAAFIGYRQVNKYLEKERLKKLLKEQQDSITNVTLPDGTTTSVNLSAVATKIYDALYNNDWLGFSEDEEGAMNAVKEVPNNIPQVSALYTSLFQKNLQTDLIKYLSADNWNSIKYLFN